MQVQDLYHKVVAWLGKANPATCVQTSYWTAAALQLAMHFYQVKLICLFSLFCMDMIAVAFSPLHYGVSRGGDHPTTVCSMEGLPCAHLRTLAMVFITMIANVLKVIVIVPLCSMTSTPNFVNLNMAC